MHRILLLFLIISGTQLLAQLRGSSPMGRIVPKKNPLAVILREPSIMNGAEWTTNQKKVTFQGVLSGEADRLVINEKETVFYKNGEFVAEMILKEGKQPLNIRVWDKKGKNIEFSVTILCQADFLPPVLTILEPLAKKSERIAVSDGILIVRGEASDPGGIAEVTVNEMKATLMGSKEFFINTSLVEGKNILTIKATDKAGNSAETILTVYRQGDMKGPSVAILEPSVSRGISIVSKKELITVRGVATDESGVEEVWINERKAPLTLNGEFSMAIPLILGDNKIIVKSIDKKRNSNIDSFTVNRALEELIKAGKYYAFIIGINKYQGEWQPLKNAVNDAKGVEKVLREHYKFDEITTFYDEKATRVNIMDKLQDYAENKITEDDNLLIFYSGHGDKNDKLDKGYWVPVDATKRNISSYICNTDIQLFLKGIRSRHTLLITDACFAGDIMRGGTSELPFEDSEENIKKVYKKKSRRALTSGGVEPVMDGGRDGHSNFTYYLLKSLNENELRYLSTQKLSIEVFGYLANNNDDQTPAYEAIKDTRDEQGHFIFIKK